MVQIPVISLALFLVSAITIGLACYALLNIKVRGALEFSLLMIALTFYIAGFGMEIRSSTVPGILSWLKIEYIGIATIPAFCIMLAIRLAGRDNWLKWWLVRLTMIFPAVILLFYFTNPLHHLFYRSIGEVVKQGFYNELTLVKGPFYYINIIYLNLALLVSVILFIRKLGKDIVERRQAWILIAGSLGPWIAHLVYQSGFSGEFDVAPFGFLLTAPLFAWGVFGNYMVFLLPKARNTVYELFGDAVFIIDNYRNLVDYNKACGALFKVLNRSMTGKPAVVVFSGSDEMERMINGTENQVLQAKFYIENVRRTFILSGSMVLNRQNQPIGRIIVMHEITDQVFLLDNLRESEEKYRLIFENTPVGVLQYDHEGAITTCNDAFVKIIGSSREVLIGLNLLNLPDSLMVKAVKDSLAGSIGYYEDEYHSVTALKATPVRGLFAPIASKGGQIRGGVGIVEDFTERHEADQHIKYREEFESILMTLELDFLNSEINEMDSTFQKGLKSLGSFCKVDRAYIFRLDQEKGMLTGTHEWYSHDAAPVIPGMRSIPVDRMPRWMGKLYNSEIVYIPDLSELPAEWKSERYVLEQQGIKSLIAVPIDITGELLGFACFDSLREKRIWNKDEIALLQVLGHILASVIKRKEANEELILARDRAEEANRVKSAFLANMSHEIRTPLNGILGFAELIQSESEVPDIQHYSDIIVSSGNRLLQTLSQILDLSRVESGKMELIIEPVQIDPIINDVVFLFSASALKKGLFLKRKPPESHLVLNLDGQLFRNSLTNLVSNSIKFTERGGIIISADVEVIQGKSYGIIRVADTGIGIPEKYFDSVFEDFRQVNEGVKRNYEGTGLGLSLTRKFVELSGGKIRVESSSGSGTTFIMTYPDPVVD